ncbi:hypothetical protein [Leifsonia sp. Leaf264]|uniref:hypothetical protein n=1 Tax=Leifsonia sp. Leaf264 TaxID=1736314 RepID=UPI0006FABF07|nr:hypothetical protein [Leifsonia sp. Leaf264]KQO98616.1 hypothetical protein ASF30_11175 [Leifsonia sp. Leaf264]
MTTKKVGEIVIRIPLMRGETGRADFIEAGNVDILALDLKGDNIELARKELADGDFWGETDLYLKVRDAVNARPTGQEIAAQILAQPWLQEILAQTRAEQHETKRDA